jgi:hypothetical protein
VNASNFWCNRIWKLSISWCRSQFELVYRK